jgi:hypothetical protein
MSVQVVQLSADVLIANERVGSGSVREAGRFINYIESPLTLEVPVDRRAINFLQGEFREHTMHLGLNWRGLARVRHEGFEQETFGPPVPAGDWHLVPFDTGSGTMSASVSRTDWVKGVLEPLGFGSFLLLELPIPSTPNAGEWDAALSHLKTAEEQYHQGNDPGVFHSCFAAFERFRGDAASAFPTISDEEKRKKINDLLAKLNAFFNSGRHTSKSGPQAGFFAVDHRDSEAALAMSKVFLTYIAKILAD